MNRTDHYRYYYGDQVKFRTAPGPAMPAEVKGTRMWFRPEAIDWTVSLDRDDQPSIYMTMAGPSTRVTHRRGEQGWTVVGRFADPIPGWVEVPWDAIYRAAGALRDIAQTNQQGGLR